MKFHKLMALFLCLSLCVSGFSVSALALEADDIISSVLEATAEAEPVETAVAEVEAADTLASDSAEEVLFSTEPAEATYLNPLYPAEETEAMLRNAEASAYALMLLDEPPAFTEETFDEAVAYYRDGVKNRAATITMSYTTDDYDKSRLFYSKDADEAVIAETRAYANSVIGEIFTKMWNGVTTHTGAPDEGDYILWHFGTRGVKAGYSSKGGSNDVTFNMTINMTYYTDYDMEQEVEAKVTEILDSLNLDDMDDYEKVCAIYDYICDHVTYDHEHLYDGGYTLKYSAYAALFHGTSVCQGYANLFYNMALRCGIDTRLVPGSAIKSAGVKEAHGWNIVKLGDKYYFVDATWDAGKAPEDYDYFLRGSDNFTDHVKGGEEGSIRLYESIVANYPISETDYVYMDGGDSGESEQPDAGDIIALMKAIAGKQTEGFDGDYNTDGVIDILDVIHLVRQLADAKA